MRRYRLRTCWLLACLLMAPVLGAAPALQERLTACAGIKDESKRLACFEAVSKDLEQPASDDPRGASQEDEAALEQEVIQIKTEREPRPQDDFGKPRKDEVEIESISARVARVRSDARGKVVVELESGQVWRQLDNDHVLLERGDRVMIRRGAFGSFILQPEDSNRRIKVRRVE